MISPGSGAWLGPLVACSCPFGVFLGPLVVCTCPVVECPGSWWTVLALGVIVLAFWWLVPVLSELLWPSGESKGGGSEMGGKQNPTHPRSIPYPFPIHPLSIFDSSYTPIQRHCFSKMPHSSPANPNPCYTHTLSIHTNTLLVGNRILRFF